MRVVIDTNVVASRFLSPNGTPALIFKAWEIAEFELLVSEAMLLEYQAVLSYKRIQERHKMTESEILEVINQFKKIATVVEVTQQLAVVAADPADNKFIECAVDGVADYIVSGDKHLLSLKTYQNIKILSPAEFLTVLSQDNN